MDVETKIKIEDKTAELAMRGLRVLVRQLPDVQGRWYLLTVNVGQERWALQNLRVNDHHAYLPVWRRTVRKTQWVQRRGVRRKVNLGDQVQTLPLFPGYLFVRVADEREWGSILKTHGVNRMVGVGGRPGAVARGEVERMQAMEALGFNEFMTETQLAARLMQLEAGSEVTVALGRLTDLKGIYCEPFDDERAVVLVSLCGCESRVKVPISRLSAGRG